MLVPASFAIILLAIRGSFYAFENYGSKESTVYTFLYGASGLLIPASLSIALTISEGGFIKEENGSVSLKYMELFTSPLSWSIVALSIVSILFISATFLAFYAARARDLPALKLVRTFALFWSTPTIIAALTTFIVLSQHNERHYESMLDLWWVFGLSVGFFLIAVWLLYRQKHYGLAFISVMLQFLFAFLVMALDITHTCLTLIYPFMKGPRTPLWALPGGGIHRRTTVVDSVADPLNEIVLFDAEYVKGKK